ncbi:MAG: hypothetical protein AAF598_10755 [Bacteroidota bacterium]
MELRYLYPHWGSEGLHIQDWLSIVQTNGFHGVEINLPETPETIEAFQEAIDGIRAQDPDFVLVLQQVFGVERESPQAYIDKVLDRLTHLATFEPNFINSHTGKDHYSFDDNCRIIEAIENFAVQSGIPVYHEIHRGRFTFHSTTLLPYLALFPELKLVGDLSHWCVVAESMLQDQADIIEQVVPHIRHLHARVGFEQSPQVNHPFAPEWSERLLIFLDWWQQIIHHHQDQNWFSITPEFGPFPYMPALPFSKSPIADQQAINVEMKTWLQAHLT